VQTTADTEALVRDINVIGEAVTRACANIALELRRPHPRNGARLAGDLRKITGLSRDLTAMQPRINAIEAALTIAANDRARKDGGPVRLPDDWYALRQGASKLRSDMNMWHEVQRLVSVQLTPQRVPLYLDDTARPAIQRTQSQVSDALFSSLHALLNPNKQDQDAQSHGCFPDIGLANSQFLEHAHAAHRVFLAQRQRHPPRFLDVGCGVGLKVKAATEFFRHADGLEYDPGYVAGARALLDALDCNHCGVIAADAFTFEDYAAYDVIYFYRPMRDDALMAKLERHMVQSARPATILIAPYAGFSARSEALGCGHVGGQVFVTQTGPDDAAALRRAAEEIGTDVSRRTMMVPGILEPILAASHANGVGVPRLSPLKA